MTSAEKYKREAARAENIAKICEANGDPDAAAFWRRIAREKRADAERMEERKKSWEHRQ